MRWALQETLGSFDTFSIAFTPIGFGTKRWDCAQMIRLTLVLMVALLGGACRKYEIDIPLQPSDVVGSWTLASAPSKVNNAIPTGKKAVGVTFQDGGKANYTIFPIPNNLILGANPSRNSSWTFLSGNGTWSIADEGTANRHIWHVRLQTDKVGLQITVGKDSSGNLILVFHPDANSNESLIFRRSGQSNN